MEEDYIKLIFGLKLKQIRTDKNLSLFGLSKLSGLSKSYLNEIENGKKYPKPDKIAALAEKLEVPYDHLVSLKLDKNLAPIGEILQSKLLKEIPLELFGIKESNLIDIIANAPAKVNAFISTIIDIAKNYNFTRESFFLASLRSYQQANNNFFEEIEQQVKAFAKAYQIDLSEKITSSDLAEILVEEFAYTINEDEINEIEALENVRSIFVPKTKTLLLDHTIDEAQRAFIYAKELAYNYLKISDRLYTFPWIKFETFDQVLHNFYASYFAGALMIPRDALVAHLTDLFEEKEVDESRFLQMLSAFNASPETFYQRLTNILPEDFNIQNLFFLRFSHKAQTDDFELTKELHISHQQSPRARENNEHYCRRWVSLRVLQNLSEQKKKHCFDAQISDYGNGVKYLVLSSATQDPFKENRYRSVSIGLLVNKQLDKKMKFLQASNIATYRVGVTCETCDVVDCEVRKAPPIMLQKVEKNQKIEQAVNQLIKQYGKN